ncbi:MAG: Na/Pi cotransporter family protein [Alistipes sp.]|nr:Na/Pi cotransporter family protein [Alistipes sp.]
MILQIFTLLGALGMFLYGMNMMSSGLQKTAGSRMRAILGSMTSNRFKSMLTGLGITSVIQSSSATTVMVVGFVNAGLLALNQAIGVIMGANIGTTVTAWLVSWLGFKADISIFAVPLMAVGFILSLSKVEKRRNISEFIIGFSLLFLGLSLMKGAVPDLQQTPEVLSFIQKWTNYDFGSVLIFMLFGTVLTLVLQSSSATMALTLIMLNLGWLPFDMAAAMVLGENIGTTITANIAASVANANSRRAALAHTLFNLFGVVWALIFFSWFTSLIGVIIESLGLPNPKTLNYADGAALTAEDSTAALYGISMLHTLFNTINTFILIWFIPLIARIVTFVIKSKPEQDDEVVHLKFIDAGPMGTAELAIEQARNETIHFANIMRNGLSYIKSAIHVTTESDFEFYRKKLVKYEEIADRVEYEIATFLNSLPQESLSDPTRRDIKSMYKIVGELESLGDSGEAVSRILSRRNIHEKRFTDKQIERIDSILHLLDRAYGVMIENLSVEIFTAEHLRRAVDCEIEINEMRNMLREEEIVKIEQSAVEYQSGVYYLDVVAEIERMGDFVINISEARQ